MENGICSKRLFHACLYILSGLLMVMLVLVIAAKGYDVYQLAKHRNYPAKSISATGVGRVVVKPDTAFINYDIVAEGESDIKTQEGYQKKLNDFTEALQKIGIAKENVSTTSFSISKDDSALAEKKYKGTVTIQVKIEDKEKIDDKIKSVYDSAMKLGFATSSSYTQCASFKDQTQYFTPAVRQQAFDDAEKNARALVAQTGLTLGSIVGVTDSMSYGPTSYYPGSGTCSYPVPGVPIIPQELVLTETLTFEVK